MQADPISGSLIYPQSLNRYGYVDNDPLNSTDSLGLVKESLWSLWAGFGLLGATNVTWDGATVPQYMLGMVAHLWASGAANIIPQGWELNARGELVNPSTDTVIDNPNDYWRMLPVSLQRKTNQDWINDAVYRGRVALELDDECKAVVSGPTVPMTQIVDWFGRLSADGGIHPGETGGAGATASPPGQPAEIRIGPKFFGRSAGIMNGEGTDFPAGLSLKLWTTIGILHELGHLTGAPSHLRRDPQAEGQYNGRIWAKCIRGKEKKLESIN